MATRIIMQWASTPAMTGIPMLPIKRPAFLKAAGREKIPEPIIVLSK